MKRITAVLLIGLLVFSLAACGEDQKAEEAPKEEVAKEEPKEEPKEESKEEPKEESKEEPKEESKEEPKEESKEEPKEEKKEEPKSNEIKLGEPITLGDFEVTVHSFEKVDTWDEKKAVKIVYGWKNNSDTEQMSFMSVNFEGYQNGVEVESTVLSDSIDLGIAQKKVQPGGGQDNCETGLMIEGDGPMEIRLKELITFDKKAFFTITINPSDL